MMININNNMYNQTQLIIISKKLFPLQLWKPTRDSYEDVQKKLLLLKTD